jgi:hypothetical protein
LRCIATLSNFTAVQTRRDGLDEVTRTALESAEQRVAQDAEPAPDTVTVLASRRR